MENTMIYGYYLVKRIKLIDYFNYLCFRKSGFLDEIATYFTDNLRTNAAIGKGKNFLCTFFLAPIVIHISIKNNV